MSMDVRRTISELVAMYSLEPELKDIYVEGTTDMELLKWFFACHGKNDINVYAIDVIDIPDGLLQVHCLNAESNRSRLLALAAELETSVSHMRKILCIADRDAEDYLPSGVSSPFLSFTDYNSLELYTFTLPTIQKFVSLVLSGFAMSPATIIDQCVPVLQAVYLVRVANQALSWGMEWVDFTKYVRIEGGVVFGREDFVKAYLLKNRKWSRRAEFEEKVAELRSRLNPDFRRRIRGHDVIKLLHCVCRKLKPKRRFGDAGTLQGAITGCLEAQELSKENLFCRLLAL